MSAPTHKPSALSATDVKISLLFTTKRQKICLCQKATNGWFQRSGDVLFTGGNRVSTKENGDLKNTEGQRPNQTCLFFNKEDSTTRKSHCSDTNTTGLLEGEQRSQGYNPLFSLISAEWKVSFQLVDCRCEDVQAVEGLLAKCQTFLC